MSGPQLSPLAWRPVDDTLIRLVTPRTRSWTNTSDRLLVSCGTRLVALDWKATKRPSAEIAARSGSRHAGEGSVGGGHTPRFACVPSEATSTWEVRALHACAGTANTTTSRATTVPGASLLVACSSDDAESLNADEVASEFERISDEIVADEPGGEDAPATDIECVDASEENHFDCTGTIVGQKREFQLVVEGDTIDVVPPKDRVPPAG